MKVIKYYIMLCVTLIKFCLWEEARTSLQVMSKLQQYMAPSRGPQMDDAAINTLFASLFGKAVQKQKGPKLEWMVSTLVYRILI